MAHCVAAIAASHAISDSRGRWAAAYGTKSAYADGIIYSGWPGDLAAYAISYTATDEEVTITGADGSLYTRAFEYHDIRRTYLAALAAANIPQAVQS